MPFLLLRELGVGFQVSVNCRANAFIQVGLAWIFLVRRNNPGDRLSDLHFDFANLAAERIDVAVCQIATVPYPAPTRGTL